MSVVIETTLGDITVDLYLEQRPVTCLNFLKLCKMKYYNFNLFHSIRSGFIAQTGDPTAEGSGGESIFGLLEGPEKRFFSGEKLPKIRHTNTGTLSMVCTGDMMVGSQFFFTLAPDLDSLDSVHCVIGEVTEGHDVLRMLNDVICDESHRPYRDVRISHTVVLEDPFNDPARLKAPSRSPSPSVERLKGGRIAADEDIEEAQGKSAQEIQEIIEEKEAKARATILEIVGDLPDADIAPPENVLFVCKLNPVTTDEDLEIIFSRFGNIVGCEVIRDKKTGDSLQYSFIEFADKKSCEDAYFKMDNVLIDDRRIHVDFSQSVSRMRWMGKGKGIKYFNNNEPKEQHQRNNLSKKDRDRGDDNNDKNGDNRRHRNSHSDSHYEKKDRDNRQERRNRHDKHKRDKDISRKDRSRSRHRSRKVSESRTENSDRDRSSKYSRNARSENTDRDRSRKEKSRSRDRFKHNTEKSESPSRRDKLDVKSKNKKDKEGSSHWNKSELETSLNEVEKHENSNSYWSQSQLPSEQTVKERESGNCKSTTSKGRDVSPRSNQIRENHSDSRNHKSLEKNNKSTTEDKYYDKKQNKKNEHSESKKEHQLQGTKQKSENRRHDSKETKKQIQNDEDKVMNKNKKEKEDKKSKEKVARILTTDKKDKTTKVKTKNIKSKVLKKKRKYSTSSSDSSSDTSSSSESSSSNEEKKKKKPDKSRKRKVSTPSSSTSSSTTSSSSSSSTDSSSTSSSSNSEPSKKKHKKIINSKVKKIKRAKKKL